MLSGVGVTLWIIIGAQIHPPPEAASSLCVSTSRCDQFQHLFINNASGKAYVDTIVAVDGCRVDPTNDSAVAAASSSSSSDYEGLAIYRISYIWYSLVAVVIVVVVGVVVSVITGANDADRIDARFISPIYHFCCEKLPTRWRKKFACKREEKENKSEDGDVKEKEDEQEEKEKKAKFEVIYDGGEKGLVKVVEKKKEAKEERESAKNIMGEENNLSSRF